ncbi:MAG: nitrogen regulation protein NR(I) [Salinisphaera sp.]|nr:nitrogen regulation protein NR(I) [Salinisphaera sp.]
MTSAWIVDDDESIRWVLERALDKAGIQARSFPGGAEALDALAQDYPDVLITDVRMPGIDGLALLQRIALTRPDLPVIVMTAYSDLDSTVAAFKGGAFEFLAKPFDVDETVRLVRRAAAGQKTTSPPRAAHVDGIVGEAPAMQAVFRAIGRLSSSHVTVLITGESGTGKELVARALHEHSPRAQGPFVAVNTAAIPKDLMESEFFGHEKGAFTGAVNQRRGRFEQARGGTLFLDEIGDMPANLQTRLLRVLADGQFYRVGGHTSLSADVRIIAATNQPLEESVARGAFREDLYHRLNVIRVRVPPLRDRRGDVPALLAFFLQRAAAEMAAPPKRMHPEAVTALTALDWPGNVRQLENLCRWLTVMAPGREITRADLPEDSRPGAAVAQATGDWEMALADWAQQRLAAGEDRILEAGLPAFERVMIRAALAHSGGRRQQAARLLGWGRNTLTRKIKELALD